MKLANVEDTLAKETETHAAQCHHMVGELCLHGWEANTLRGRVMGNR